MERQTIEIMPDGEITIVVRGVKGKSCYDASRQVEEALGKTRSDAKTGEYHEQSKVSHRA